MLRHADVGQMADVIRRTRGRPTRRLAAIIAGGPAPTASGDEDTVLDLLLGRLRAPRRREDAERQAALQAIGERVLRTTKAQAILRPQQLIRRLELAGAPRASTPRRRPGAARRTRPR
jgi:hypothetical protein